MHATTRQPAFGGPSGETLVAGPPRPVRGHESADIARINDLGGSAACTGCVDRGYTLYSREAARIGFFHQHPLHVLNRGLSGSPATWWRSAHYFDGVEGARASCFFLVVPVTSRAPPIDASILGTRFFLFRSFLSILSEVCMKFLDRCSTYLYDGHVALSLSRSPYLISYFNHTSNSMERKACEKRKFGFYI